MIVSVSSVSAESSDAMCSSACIVSDTVRMNVTYAYIYRVFQQVILIPQTVIDTWTMVCNDGCLFCRRVLLPFWEPLITDNV